MKHYDIKIATTAEFILANRETLLSISVVLLAVMLMLRAIWIIIFSAAVGNTNWIYLFLLEALTELTIVGLVGTLISED